MIHSKALGAVGVIHGEDSKSWGERAPLIVVCDGPMKIAQHRHVFRNKAAHLRDMGLEKLASGKPVASRVGNAVVELSAKRHPVLRDENSTLKFLSVVFAKEVQALRKHVPIPPFAREAVHQMTAQAFPSKFQVDKRRRAEEVAGEGIVIIEAYVVEHPIAFRVRERVQKIAERLCESVLWAREG